MFAQIILLALAASAFARPSEVVPVAPIGIIETIPYDLCPADQRHYLLPHEYDCTKFYYCEYGERWITPTDCAPGTHFSYEIQVCVHPAQAGCTLPGVPPTDAPATEVPETEAPVTTTSAPLSTEASVISTSSAAPETEAPQTEAPVTTTSAPLSTEASVISTSTSAPLSTEASVISTSTSAPLSTEASVISTSTAAPVTTTSAPLSTEASVISTSTAAPVTTTSAPLSTEASVISTSTSAPLSTEASVISTSTSAPLSTEASVISTSTSAPLSTEASVISTSTSAPLSTEASVISTTTSAPLSTEASVISTSTSAPLSTEASVISTSTSAPLSTEASVISTSTSAPLSTEASVISTSTSAPLSTEASVISTTTSAPLSTEASVISTSTSAPLSTEASVISTTTSAPLSTEASVISTSTAAPETEPTSAPENEVTPPPGTEWLGNGCPASFDVHWLLPHEDCTKFYYCNFGLKVERDCPPTLHFNPKLQVCDWAENAGCAATDAPATDAPATDAPATDAPATDAPATDAATTDASATDAPSTDAPATEWLENGCPADLNVHWLLPHESDCAKFYYCVHGELVERECSAPLHFNPTLQVCDWAENAGCANGDNPTTDAPATDAPTTDAPATEWLDNGCPADWNVHWLLPHESDCAKFFYCVQGELVERECSAPLHFNPTLQVCDWAENAGCATTDAPAITDAPATDTPATDAPATEWLENGCPADLDVHWLLPHESDCAKFYYCVRGEIVERECREPLHFNPTLQVCDWAENAGCAAGEASTETPETEAPDTEATETTVAPSSTQISIVSPASTVAPVTPETEVPQTDAPATDAPATDAPTTDAPVTDAPATDAPATDWLDNGCPADFSVHWLIPHESDCARFYYCVNGKTVERECREPLHFNPAIQVCDWPENVDCGNTELGSGESSGEEPGNSDEEQENSGEEPESSGEEPGDSGEDPIVHPEEEPDHAKCAENCNLKPWAHATACDKYWRCEGNQAVLAICSEGLHFNANSGSCDFICNANCLRENVQTTADNQGLKIFVPWDKVSAGMRYY